MGYAAGGPSGASSRSFDSHSTGVPQLLSPAMTGPGKTSTKSRLPTDGNEGSDPKSLPSITEIVSGSPAERSLPISDNIQPILTTSSLEHGRQYRNTGQRVPEALHRDPAALWGEQFLSTSTDIPGPLSVAGHTLRIAEAVRQPSPRLTYQLPETATETRPRPSAHIVAAAKADAGHLSAPRYSVSPSSAAAAGQQAPFQFLQLNNARYNEPANDNSSFTARFEANYLFQSLSLVRADASMPANHEPC